MASSNMKVERGVTRTQKVMRARMRVYQENVHEHMKTFAISYDDARKLEARVLGILKDRDAGDNRMTRAVATKEVQMGQWFESLRKRYGTLANDEQAPDDEGPGEFLSEDASTKVHGIIRELIRTSAAHLPDKIRLEVAIQILETVEFE